MSSHPPIQIVDKHDNVIGDMDIGQAYSQGKIHRIARVMLEDAKGAVLLQKRSAHVKRWPNRWDNSVAGHVDSGENYLIAAKREMAEEIGIAGIDLQNVGNYYSEFVFNDLIVKRFNQVYKAIIDHDTKFDLQPAEVAGVQWFSIKEIKELIAKDPDACTDGLKDTIARFYS